ncbi:MAG: SIS domain-containing protein [Oscillospiraceae bacterium]|jgi:uncharacterized phosphosugar-binding protein|nr:SIS domain-containing protein [Oscillospiraceae bacterium]
MNALNQYCARAAAMLDEAFSKQYDALETAARAIFTSLKNGGMVYTFGTGHAHLLSEEIFYRAGGLARVCPILDERLMLHLSASESTNWEREPGVADALLARYPVRADDVLIVASNSGRNAAPVELAALAKQKGAFVIALTSLSHSRAAAPRNTLNKRLFETADLALDNMGVPGDAALPSARGGAVGATSTVVGAALLQAIVCRVEQLSSEENAEIEFYVSSNIEGGDEINSRLINKYKNEIKHL